MVGPCGPETERSTEGFRALVRFRCAQIERGIDTVQSHDPVQGRYALIEATKGSVEVGSYGAAVRYIVRYDALRLDDVYALHIAYVNR